MVLDDTVMRFQYVVVCIFLILSSIFSLSVPLYTRMLLMIYSTAISCFLFFSEDDPSFYFRRRYYTGVPYIHALPSFRIYIRSNQTYETTNKMKIKAIKAIRIEYLS